MNYIQQLTERVEAEGTLQISGGVFKEFESVRIETGEKYMRQPNHTVESYCEEMGKHCKTSGEEYARELLCIMDCELGEPKRFGDGQGLVDVEADGTALKRQEYKDVVETYREDSEL